MRKHQISLARASLSLQMPYPACLCYLTPRPRLCLGFRLQRAPFAPAAAAGAITTRLPSEAGGAAAANTCHLAESVARQTPVHQFVAWSELIVCGPVIPVRVAVFPRLNLSPCHPLHERPVPGDPPCMAAALQLERRPSTLCWAEGGAGISAPHTLSLCHSITPGWHPSSLAPFSLPGFMG